MSKVYLDSGAGVAPCTEVMNNIRDFAEIFYNASSINELSKYNKQVIENTRNRIAKMINAEPEEIIFTSCASESNSLAIDGFLKAHEDYCVISTTIEHDSIIKNPNIAKFIDVNTDGFVRPSDFSGYKKTLFACMMANNEIGTIQPIGMVSKVVHNNSDNYLFVDATASFGHLRIDVKDMGIDMLTAASQKVGGINGCAFLYVRNGIKLKPIIYGSQENGVRGGTYNQLAIKCLNIALDKIEVNLNKEFTMRMKRDYLVKCLLNIDGIHLNGSLTDRLSNNINIRFDNLNIDSQQIVSILDNMGYIVSPSSACNSGETTPSHVLKAIRLTDEQANHSIRITLNNNTDVQELDGLISVIKSMVQMHKIKEKKFY